MLKSTSNWPHLACVMAELVIQREAHATQYKTVQGVLEQKENLQEIRCGAVAAVLNSQPPDVNVLYDIARQKQVSSHDNVEKHVASVKIYLNQAEERILPHKDCKQTLEELTRELDSAVIHMQTAADLAREMNRLKPDQWVRVRVRGEGWRQDLGEMEDAIFKEHQERELGFRAREKVNYVHLFASGQF